MTLFSGYSTKPWAPARFSNGISSRDCFSSMTVTVTAPGREDTLVGSTVSYWLYDWWLTWAILIGSAAFDGILYLLVKDVVVCYRCNAEHRGVLVDPERHTPFELTVHERYRQEKLRKEAVQAQLLSQGKSPR